MFLEASTGFSGAFARQTTLNEATAAPAQVEDLEDLLAALEDADEEGSVMLQGEGLYTAGGEASPVVVSFGDGVYTDHVANMVYTRSELIAQAVDGELVLTLTARVGTLVGLDTPQPLLWSPLDPDEGMVRHDFPRLPEENPMTLLGDHIPPDAYVLIDGERVVADLSCGAEGGTLPDCLGDMLSIDLASPPTEPGMHLLQVQTPGGLLSNEFLIFVND
jgi:hypothetical protein